MLKPLRNAALIALRESGREADSCQWRGSMAEVVLRKRW